MESPRNGQVPYLVKPKRKRDTRLAPLEPKARKRLAIAWERVGLAGLLDPCQVKETSLRVANRGDAVSGVTRERINAGVRRVLNETKPPPVVVSVVPEPAPAPPAAEHRVWTNPLETPSLEAWTLPLAVEVQPRTLLPPVATLARRAHSLAQALDDAEPLFAFLAEMDDRDQAQGLDMEDNADHRWLCDRRTQLLLQAYRRSGLRNRAE